MADAAALFLRLQLLAALLLVVSAGGRHSLFLLQDGRAAACGGRCPRGRPALSARRRARASPAARARPSRTKVTSINRNVMSVSNKTTDNRAMTAPPIRGSFQQCWRGATARVVAFVVFPGVRRGPCPTRAVLRAPLTGRFRLSVGLGAPGMSLC